MFRLLSLQHGNAIANFAQQCAIVNDRLVLLQLKETVYITMLEGGIYGFVK